MPNKPKITTKDQYTIILGVLVALMVQILYDVVRSIMPVYGQIIIVLFCGFFAFLILWFFRKESDLKTK